MNLGSRQQDPEYMNNVKEHMIQKEMRSSKLKCFLIQCNVPTTLRRTPKTSLMVIAKKLSGGKNC